MAVRIEQRLRRIERFRPACTTCGGEGQIAVSYHHPGEPEPEGSSGCPGCGEGLNIIVRYIKKDCMGR